MRVLAVDYGTRNIGLAVCDELRIAVRPLATIRVAGLKRAEIIKRISEAAREYEAATILVGLPLRMDGTRGDAAERVERFIADLEREVEIPVIARDERLTSRAAEERLRAEGASQRERRARSDETAAVIILEDYLAEIERRQSAARPDSLPHTEFDA
jgi:putative Holliday junction resolvase